MKLSESRKKKLESKVIFWERLFYVVLFSIGIFEAWSYYTGAAPSFTFLLIFTYSYILIFEVLPYYFYSRNILDFISPIMIIIAAFVGYFYFNQLYLGWEYELFMWIYLLCLSKLVSEAINPEKHNQFTKNSIIIVVLVFLGMYYTQVQFAPNEWIGLVLLLLGGYRVMFSVAFFFVLLESKRSHINTANEIDSKNGKNPI